MDREYLLSEAKKIKQPSTETTKEFSEKREAIAASVSRALGERKDLPESEKAKGNGMIRDDHTYHLKHMEALFTIYSPEEYVDTTLWTARMYTSHGFNIAHWQSILTTVVSVLKKELTPAAYAEIYPFYEWMIGNISVFTKLSTK